MTISFSAGICLLGHILGFDQTGFWSVVFELFVELLVVLFGVGSKGNS